MSKDDMPDECGDCQAVDQHGVHPCFACVHEIKNPQTERVERYVAFPIFVIIEREGTTDTGHYYHWIIARQENGTHVYITFDDANMPSVTALLRDQ